MRQADLWQRLDQVLGEDYAPGWADTVSHALLGGRTVSQALTDGLDVRLIWDAACDNLEIPHAAR